MRTARESLLIRSFAELADTLVDEFDVVDLLTLLTDRCVELLDVAAAGLLLASVEGELKVLASSSDAMRLLELFELQAADGPCFECCSSGAPVIHEALSLSDGRWPQFTPRALEAGFHSVVALPMRLRGHTIGALNLFRSEEGGLNEADVTAAQAFADVATIAILQHRAASQAQAVNEQLANALNSRVVIEQAKGMVAERLSLNMEESFSRIRGHARNHNLRLVDVARRIIDGTQTAASLDTTSRPRP